MSVMKKQACAFLLLWFVFISCGCVQHSVIQQSTPTETVSPTTTATENTTLAPTVPATTIPAELIIPAESEEICTQLPFMIGYAPDTNADIMETQMTKLVWDVESGTLSSPEYLYSFVYDDPFDLELLYWDGRNTAMCFSSCHVSDVADGVAMVDHKQYGYAVHYGKSAFAHADTKILRVFTENGEYEEYSLPTNHDDVIDRSYGTLRSPHYATVVGNVGIAAFVKYDKPAADAELLYTIFHVDDTDEAQWNSVPIPMEYNVDVYVNWNGAYSDGVLYLASAKDILAFDLDTAELEVLDENSLFAPIFDAFPGYTTSFGEQSSTFVLEGSQNGTVVVQIPLYDEKGELCIAFVAFRGDTLLGVMVQHDNGVFTFYDGEMNQINSTNEYQHKFLSSRVQFARDD